MKRTHDRLSKGLNRRDERLADSASPPERHNSIAPGQVTRPKTVIPRTIITGTVHTRSVARHTEYLRTTRTYVEIIVYFRTPSIDTEVHTDVRTVDKHVMQLSFPTSARPGRKDVAGCQDITFSYVIEPLALTMHVIILRVRNVRTV